MDYIKKLSWGLMAMTAVVGCSHENTVPDEIGDGNHYMAVSLAMADGSENATKVENPIFEAGSYEESAVNVANSIFLFYDGTGNYLTSGKIVATSSDLDEKGNLKLGNSEIGSVEKKSNAVIVMDKMPIRPSQVLAVLNYSGTEDLKKKSIDEVDAILTSDAISTEAGKFLMSNSVYVEKGAIVRGTAISRDQVKNTAAEALSAPVNIFVERAVAKIRMTAKSGLETVQADDCTAAGDVGKLCFDVTSATSILDGHFVDLRVVVDGWCVNAFNAKGYILKTLDSRWATTAPFDGWNITNTEGQNSYYRSFWAKDANYDGNDDYVFGLANQLGTYTDLQYRSWNDAVKAKRDAYTYLYENTVSKEACNANPGDKTNATTVLIAAHLEYRNSTADNIADLPVQPALSADPANPWKRITLYKYDGLYYTKDNIITQIAARLASSYKWKYSVAEGQKVEDIKPGQLDVEFLSNDSENKSTVKINVKSLTAPVTDAKLYENDVEIPAGEWTSHINASLATAYADGMVSFFNGDCYYQVPVVHHTNADILYGIVRNHIYNLTLSNITNVGNPVFNPDEKLVVVPGTREDYYVAAELRLLKWTVVSQDVNL